jgi:putative DNA primase/helicase
MMTDYAKLIFNVNKMDSANIEHTHGFYRRLLIIPFSKTIADEDQDRDLHTKILSNRAGVLNWIIAGAEQVIKSRNIFISDECEQFKLKFIKETDSVAMFEVDLLEELRGSTYFKTVTDAYLDYKAYCSEAGHSRPLNRNNFSNRMVAIGYEKSKKINGWHLEKNFIEKRL